MRYSSSGKHVCSSYCFAKLLIIVLVPVMIQAVDNVSVPIYGFPPPFNLSPYPSSIQFISLSLFHSIYLLVPLPFNISHCPYIYHIPSSPIHSLSFFLPLHLMSPLFICIFPLLVCIRLYSNDCCQP